MGKGKLVTTVVNCYLTSYLFFREHLQSFNVSIESNISPRTLFKGNKQIVRCSWYDSNVS